VTSTTTDDPPIGKEYPPLTYQVGREKIREYARAVGETDPLHLDLAAARAAGHADLVAPPMFVVVYTSDAIGAAFFDPEVAIDFARLVHGAQEFRWSRPLIAGEEVATVVRLDDVQEIATAGLTSYVFTHETTAAGGEVVSTGRWTNHVRGAGA
jgi:acyl dehydratase